MVIGQLHVLIVDVREEGTLTDKVLRTFSPLTKHAARMVLGRFIIMKLYVVRQTRHVGAEVLLEASFATCKSPIDTGDSRQ